MHADRPAKQRGSGDDNHRQRAAQRPGENGGEGWHLRNLFRLSGRDECIGREIAVEFGTFQFDRDDAPF